MVDANRLRTSGAILSLGDIPDGSLVRRVGNTLVGASTGEPAKTVGTTYVHVQSSASTTWTITHNLGRYPSVTVVDSAGTHVMGGVEYVSADKLILRFSAGFSGKAYLN